MKALSFRKVLLATLPALLLLVAACETEDPQIAKAKQIHGQTVATDENFAVYAIQLAGRTDSEFARTVVRDALESENYAYADAAINALAENPDPAMKERLKALFEVKSGLQKMHLATALGMLGDDAAVSYLGEQVAQNVPSASAVKILKEAGRAKDLEPMLKQMVGSDDASIRAEAYNALGGIGDDWSNQLLVAGLDKEFGEGRRPAIEALGRTGNPDLAPQISRFTNTQGLVFATLDALGRMGNPNTARAVAKMKDHRQALVRAHAGPALLRLGDAEAGTVAILSVLEENNIVAHEELAAQLGGIDAELVREPLARLTQSEDAAVRGAAFRSLRESNAFTRELLVRGLEDKSYEVAAIALEVLAKSGDADLLPTLEPLLENRSPYVAIAAANAILAIRERIPAPSGA